MKYVYRSTNNQNIFKIVRKYIDIQAIDEDKFAILIGGEGLAI